MIPLRLRGGDGSESEHQPRECYAFKTDSLRFPHANPWRRFFIKPHQARHRDRHRVGPPREPPSLYVYFRAIPDVECATTSAASEENDPDQTLLPIFAQSITFAPDNNILGNGKSTKAGRAVAKLLAWIRRPYSLLNLFR